MDIQKRISILLVDDHAMMREGTRRLLEEDAMLNVIGEAQDGAEAIAFFQEYQADVVILDIAMKSINGFGVARSLLALPQSPAILVFTAYDELAYIQTMLKLGVRGYWLKSAHSSDIRRAVHEVAIGRRSLGPEIRQLLTEEDNTAHQRIEPFTTRELDVLRLVARGYRNGEIADNLSISIKTVETHLTSLYSKLGVQSRAEVIAFAQRQGLLLES